jgi:hypothetical protein
VKVRLATLLHFGMPFDGKFWYTYQRFALWTFNMFYGYLVYSVDIWYILWAFGIFCGHLVYFVGIWYILPGKSGNPDKGQRKTGEGRRICAVFLD